MRVLALDHGEARCGCAVCDPTGDARHPARCVSSGPTPEAGLGALAAPRARARGRAGRGRPAAHAARARRARRPLDARAFAERLAARVGVPVELHDERLTTRQAERTGGTADADSRAAAHLLESFLARGRRAGSRE